MERRGGSMRLGGRSLVVASMVAAVLLPACKDAAPEESAPSEPVILEPIKGTDLSRVTLEARAAERLGIETAAVTMVEGETTVPASAVWVDVNGEEWVYTALEPLVFVREVIDVDRYEGNVAVLSDGPAAETKIVSVGVAELIGSEFGI
jgi:hypothetical protein